MRNYSFAVVLIMLVNGAGFFAYRSVQSGNVADAASNGRGVRQPDALRDSIGGSATKAVLPAAPVVAPAPAAAVVPAAPAAPTVTSVAPAVQPADPIAETADADATPTRNDRGRGKRAPSRGRGKSTTEAAAPAETVAPTKEEPKKDEFVFEANPYKRSE